MNPSDDRSRRREEALTFKAESQEPKAELGAARLASETPGQIGRKILLLGLGNDILSDDAVGLRIAAEVRQRLAGLGDIEVVETAEMGLSLLDFIVGYDTLVLVDAVQTGRHPAGFLHEIDGYDLKVLPTVSPHFLGIGEILALGRELGLHVPRRVRIFAVEVEDPFTVGRQMTARVQQAVPAIVDRISASLRLMTTAVLPGVEGATPFVTGSRGVSAAGGFLQP